MAIIAYTGLPGDGKSYGVVDNVILKNLRDGRVVWSNIPMHADQLDAHIPGHKFHQIGPYDDSWKDGTALATIPKGCILVLDELWTVLPSGMKAHQIPQAWKSYFAEHRHMVGDDGFSSEIVIVTQDLQDVASFARNKVQKTFIVRKLWAIGANNRFIVDCYRGAVTGQRGPEVAKVGTASGQYDPEVYKFYRSHTKGGGQVGHEVVADKRGIVWKHPMIRIGIPMALIAVAASVFMGLRFLHNMTGDAPSEVAAKAQDNVSSSRPGRILPPGHLEQRGDESPSAAQVDEVPAVPKGPAYSKRWRVAGFVIRESGDGYVVLVDDARLTRFMAYKECNVTGPLTGDVACVVDGDLATAFTGSANGWLPTLVNPKT